MRVENQELSSVTMKCNYDPDKVVAFWGWTNPFNGQLVRTLPQCSKLCKSQPPSRPDLVWIKEKVDYNRVPNI